MIAVSGVLLLIIMSSRFVKYLADAAAGKLAPEVLFAIMGYRIPGFLELILPLGLFIAFLLAYGRLYMDSEMVVLSACGMTPKRLMAYSMLPAVLVALVVASLSLAVSPMGIQKADEILKAQKQRNELDHLVPARFQKTKGDGGVIYAETLSSDRKLMNSVFIAEMEKRNSAEASELAVIRAEKGERVTDTNGQSYLKLTNGYRYSGNPGTNEYDIVQFDAYMEHIVSEPADRAGSVKADAIPTSKLMHSTNAEDVATLHWRFSLPVLVVVVTLLAVPLSKTNPRQGRYIQMIPAILIYIVYLVSLNAARGSVEDGATPMSIWLVHLCALSLVCLLWFWPAIQRQWRRLNDNGVKHA